MRLYPCAPSHISKNCSFGYCYHRKKRVIKRYCPLTICLSTQIPPGERYGILIFFPVQHSSYLFHTENTGLPIVQYVITLQPQSLALAFRGLGVEPSTSNERPVIPVPCLPLHSSLSRSSTNTIICIIS